MMCANWSLFSLTLGVFMCVQVTGHQPVLLNEVVYGADDGPYVRVCLRHVDSLRNFL